MLLSKCSVFRTSFFCLSMAIVGCGGKEGTQPLPGTPMIKRFEPKGEMLSGKVTYKGAPVTGGKIKLFEEHGRDFEIHIRRDGTYKFLYLPVGDMKVTIETESTKGEMAKYEELAKKIDPGRDVPPLPPIDSVPIYVKIPEKYGKVETSGLSMNVKKGENIRDFELKD